MKNTIIFALLYLLAFNQQVFSEENALGVYYRIARENCHDIASIRKEMDRINQEILVLLVERTAYVKRAGDLKSRTTKVADDRQRVADQERKIVEASNMLGLPNEISLEAFRVIMEQSIQFQQRYIDQLTLHEQKIMVGNGQKGE